MTGDPFFLYLGAAAILLIILGWDRSITADVLKLAKVGIFFAALASFFAMCASVIHFEILAALGFFILMAVSGFVLAWIWDIEILVSPEEEIN